MEFIKKTVSTDFARTAFTDFEIKCADRSFFVHKCVLSAHKYFRSVLESSSENSILELPQEDSTIISCVLRHIYNEDWVDIKKICVMIGPDMKTALQSKFEADEVRDALYHLSKRNGADLAIVAQNSSAAAEVLVFALKRFALLHATAHSFSLRDLKDHTFNAFEEIQHSAWCTSNMLDVITAVYSSCENSDSELCRYVASGIVDRITLLLKSKRFLAMLTELKVLARDVIREMAVKHAQPTWKHAASVRYCASRSCLRNRETNTDKKGQVQCKVCKTKTGLQEAHDRMWPNEDIEQVDDDMETDGSDSDEESEQEAEGEEEADEEMVDSRSETLDDFKDEA